MLYRIRDWDKHFENASSRKLKRLDWVAIPNKTDGEGYCALVDHPNAAAHLGAWYAIVEAASKQTPRGNLPGGFSQGIGGICRSLGRISRLPEAVFAEAIPRLEEIGWLECYQQDAGTLGESATASAESANVVGESATASADSGRAVVVVPVVPCRSLPAALAQTEWPLTTAAIAAHDPAVDQIFVLRLAQTAAQALISAGDLEPFDDEDLADAVKESYEKYSGRRAHGVGLLLNRVPQILRNWGKCD